MRSIIIAAIVLCFATSIQGHAQEKNIRAGIGASLSTDILGLEYYNVYGLAWHSTTAVRIPVEFGRKFRIEPELGLKTYSSKHESSSGTTTDTYSYQGYRLSLAASYLMPNVGGKEYLQASIGGRVSLNGFHTEDKSTASGTSVTREGDRTDIGFGAFVGAEYFPVKEFSVGGEIGLSAIAVGETTRDPQSSSYSYSSPDGVSMGLYGSLHLRWFIF